MCLATWHYHCLLRHGPLSFGDSPCRDGSFQGLLGESHVLLPFLEVSMYRMCPELDKYNGLSQDMNLGK